MALSFDVVMAIENCHFVQSFDIQIYSIISQNNLRDAGQYDKPPDTALQARPYQVEIVDIAKKKNTIVCLGTGTGKTFISVMLIKERQGSIQGDLISGGKRTFFLVNTGILFGNDFLYCQSIFFLLLYQKHVRKCEMAFS